jgi:hypothetical protein
LGNDVAIQAYREGKLHFRRHDHCCFALPQRCLEENNKVFASLNLCSQPPRTFSYGQGLNKSTPQPAAGVRYLRRQVWRRGVYESCFPPREGQRKRPCLYSLCLNDEN